MTTVPSGSELFLSKSEAKAHDLAQDNTRGIWGTDAFVFYTKNTVYNTQRKCTQIFLLVVWTRFPIKSSEKATGDHRTNSSSSFSLQMNLHAGELSAEHAVSHYVLFN